MVTLGDKRVTHVALLECTNCKKTYKNRTGLWRHKKANACGVPCCVVDATEGYASATSQTPFQCEFCGKSYLHRQGLWRHKQTCISAREPTDKQLILMLLHENTALRKEQSDIKDLILQIVKNGTHHTTITHNTNSNNKAFNLNVFLNETCKNAMNITDFVDSIKLQLSDFMEVGELGYVEGISNIIVKNLNALDETIRPIHCTDQKRETFYVKDEDTWQREEADKQRLKQLIKTVSFKNETLMKTYKEHYPDYNDPESKRSDQYSKTVIEAMDCKEESREKIIRNISKATLIRTRMAI